MRRTNSDLAAADYGAGEATDHVLKRIKEPSWFVIGGPASANEVAEVHGRWPNCQLLGIEPSPVGFAAAAKKWPPKGYLLRLALWNSPDETIRLYHPDDLLHSTAFPDSVGFQHDVPGTTEAVIDEDYDEVKTITIDDLDDTHHFTNGVLWMDIEGAERRALYGAVRTLSRFDSFHTIVLEVVWGTADAVAAILSRFGFKLDYVYHACPTKFNGVWIR